MYLSQQKRIEFIQIEIRIIMTINNIHHSKYHWICKILISFVIMLLISGLGGMLSNDDNVTSFILFIAMLIAIIYLLAKFPNIIKINKPSTNGVLMAFLLGSSIQLIPFGSSSSIYFTPYINYGFIGKMIFVLLLVVILPVVEEIYFRGLLYQIISNAISSKVGLLVSIILFTVLHIPSKNEFMFIAIASTIFSLLMYKYKNVIISIIAHISYNLTCYVIFLLSN